MCNTVVNTCGCGGKSTSPGVGSFLLALAGAALVMLLRGLVALAVWASPRAWRLIRRAVRDLRMRWEARHGAVVVEELPMPRAIDTKPHGHLLWSELSKEQRR